VADWYPTEDGASVVNRSVPRDWSGSVYLNLWLYCEETAGAELKVSAGSEQPATPDGDGYEAGLPLDWVGWKLVELPLAAFRRHGEPLGWQSIDELRLTAELPGAGAPGARLCLDDIWLSVAPGASEGPAVVVAGDPGPTPGPIAPTVNAPGDGAGQTAPAPPDTARLLQEALEAKRKGDFELAFTKYVAVLLREPTSVEAHWGLAWVLASKGEREAAIEHFAKVAELSDDPARVREAKAALARLRAGGKP
jgi:tetratricopeptide (TPR) repeat protein